MLSLLEQVSKFTGIALVHNTRADKKAAKKVDNSVNDDARAIQYTTYETLIAEAKALRAKGNLPCQAVLTFDDLTTFVTYLLAYEGVVENLYLQPEAPLALPNTSNAYNSSTNTVDITHKKPAATVWHLATSGTTGTPKWIAHTSSSLCRAIKHGRQHQQTRWALCYQPFRYAGLQVILQSLLNGATLVDCTTADTAKKVDIIRREKVNAISATPTLWRQFLLSGAFSDSSPTFTIEKITLGGEITDAPLMALLASQFSNAKIMHVYASTEAGVGFAVTDGQPGFPKQWLTSGVNGNSLKVDSENVLWIKANAAQNTKLNKINNTIVEVDSQGYVNTNDVVIIKDNRVYFKGRANGAINVGGQKVHPEHVEQALLQSPLVSQARVYAKQSSIMGQLVVADVVLSASKDIETKPTIALLLHCKKHLARFEMPTKINVTDSIAINASGKIGRAQQASTE
ncbi:ANL family adenylate-forming protein [Alteromonas stellipolaris]|uniref:ANL family adenylate-forming protein n=1 Tax=Alteromonas stellipolaris TaxID=233316 RepID=UPI0027366D06|nr:fatty acid--CoA ligase family protein [Alteromonas stellipolaris]MDP2597858.1 fatty acid--CoA ligase family protein [Alteromonas stellipolaris]